MIHFKVDCKIEYYVKFGAINQDQIVYGCIRRGDQADQTWPNSAMLVSILALDEAIFKNQAYLFEFRYIYPCPWKAPLPVDE